jgi:hypothetical protein
LRRERHPDSPMLQVNLAVLKFPGRSNQNVQNTNVCRLFLSFPTHRTILNLLEATIYTAKAEDVMAITYEPFALPSDASASASASKVDSENGYIQSVLNPEKRAYDAAAPMELHLQKELSNPHSRAKKQARWQAAFVRRRELLAQYMRNELKDLKGRTRREARAEAVWKWRERLAADVREEKKRRWIHRGGEAALLRRRGRLARKKRKLEERLRNLVLEEAPNQVIPATIDTR